MQLVLDLLDACALDIDRLLGGTKIGVEAFPLMLPLGLAALGGGERGRRAALGVLCQLDLGGQTRELLADRLQLLFVAGDLVGERLQRHPRLTEIGALALTRVTRVLDLLFGTRDIGTDRIETPLDLTHRIGLLGMEGTLRLDRRFGAAQIGERRLHRKLALAHGRILHLRAAVEIAQTQREQLCREAALLLLQHLVAASTSGLTLQVTDLLVDLVTQVLQPLEVLPGVGNAALGLLASLLVPRDPRRLFDEGAHVIGLGLDEAGDHALLDDRVAARAETGPEEQLGDVLAAAAGAVDVVGARAVARDLATQRHFGIGRIGATDLAVGVVEHQLDRRLADRLARARAVEDDIGHGVATQVLGGQFAHHPAHGIDDIGLAAAVRTDDAGEVAGEGDGGRVDEGLEPGELDLGQTHAV